MAADAPRILITRLSALGDIIHTLPVAFAIKDKYPRATIAWLVQGRLHWFAYWCFAVGAGLAAWQLLATVSRVR